MAWAGTPTSLQCITLCSQRHLHDSYRIPQLRQLLRSIITDPLLGKLIRKLTARDEFVFGYKSIESTAVVQDLQEAVSNRPPLSGKGFTLLLWREPDNWVAPDSRQWITDLGMLDQADAQLALLLPHLPALETLDMMLGTSESYLSMIFYEAAINPQRMAPLRPLQNLKTYVNFVGADHATPKVHQWIARLPAIEEICLNRVDDVCCLKLKARSSPVRHLEFRESCISGSDFEVLLSAPRSLRTFIYEIANHVRRFSYQGTPFGQALRGLQAQEESLEELWIGYSVDYYQEPNPRELSVNLLKGFTKLEKLKIAISCFPDSSLSNCLPPSLKSLWLLHATSQEWARAVILINDLFSMRNSQPSLLPQLQDVTIACSNP